jgi:hypothetical protein
MKQKIAQQQPQFTAGRKAFIDLESSSNTLELLPLSFR